MTRERFERAREPWGFDLIESLYWSALAKRYWRLLDGRPDDSEESAKPEGSP